MIRPVPNSSTTSSNLAIQQWPTEIATFLKQFASSVTESGARTFGVASEGRRKSGVSGEKELITTN